MEASSQPYSIDQAAALLQLSITDVHGFVQAGFVKDAAGFSFQDLVLLRTAKALTEQQLPRGRIRTALARLREKLPAEQPLSGLTLVAEGGRLLARDAGAQFCPESGQVLLDFSAVETSPPPPAPLVRPGADDACARGCLLESDDPEAARQAYELAIRLDPLHADAHVNLGRLFHERGFLDSAEKHYRLALTAESDHTTAQFNLAVALEDQKQVEHAAQAYLRTLEIDPGFADAHFNLSVLYEQQGQKTLALRHLKEYRRLTVGP